MVCNNCRKEIHEKAVMCVNCGCEIKKEESYPFGWGVLGFSIPVAGFILFLLWRTDKPKTAKCAANGALISLCLAAIYAAFIFYIMAITFSY